MKITRKVVQPIDVVEDIFCNLCGLSCKSPMGEYYGLIEAEVTAGYESTHLEDGDVHKFSLCERCLADMIAKFKYSSFQGNYMIPEEATGKAYAEDFSAKKYWNQNGAVFIDDIAPEDLSSALQLEEPILGDSFHEDDGLLYDSEEEEYVTANFPPKKKEDLN